MKVLFAASQIAPGASVVANLPPAYGGDGTGSYVAFATVTLVPGGDGTYNDGYSITITDVNGNTLATSLGNNSFVNGVGLMPFQVSPNNQPVTIANNAGCTINTVSIADGQYRQ